MADVDERAHGAGPGHATVCGSLSSLSHLLAILLGDLQLDLLREVALLALPLAHLAVRSRRRVQPRAVTARPRTGQLTATQRPLVPGPALPSFPLSFLLPLLLILPPLAGHLSLPVIPRPFPCSPPTRLPLRLLRLPSPLGVAHFAVIHLLPVDEGAGQALPPLGPTTCTPLSLSFSSRLLLLLHHLHLVLHLLVLRTATDFAVISGRRVVERARTTLPRRRRGGSRRRSGGGRGGLGAGAEGGRGGPLEVVVLEEVEAEGGHGRQGGGGCSVSPSNLRPHRSAVVSCGWEVVVQLAVALVAVAVVGRLVRLCGGRVVVGLVLLLVLLNGGPLLLPPLDLPLPPPLLLLLLLFLLLLLVLWW